MAMRAGCGAQPISGHNGFNCPPSNRPIIKILIGPTASGKSRLALEWARQQSIVSPETPQIINADAMQHYRPLRIITARPSVAEEAEFPHRLYGVLSATQMASAVWWREEVLRILREAPTVPSLIVGGTGLYIKALTEGLSPIPTVDLEYRSAAAARLALIGNLDFHSEIRGFDSVAASVIRVSDRQRMIRAWEVFHATRRPLSEWQAEPRTGKPDDFEFQIEPVILARSILVERINRRVEIMIADGAVAEVAKVLDYDPPLADDLPMMKAIGVSSLLKQIRGEIDLATAITEIQGLTRAYAKRQMTWIRGMGL